ncbi:MAG TPA: 2-amino-4-hydroxy-6-hydroxymethyldihydropteridine diphosphokinase [Caulobacteraceae bacterium]|jgi:2-amino-4-hydroxy-6-hydroxymethyldihydropteridine diphosphokinase|nr:2-amino-4-hydroxy-6-hydroxymethyldihydropteridine diphosphokinase [Caulobacteraceae bacterium]
MWDEAVVVALGSNLAGGFASSKALLAAALEAFEPAGLRVLKRSSWWRSRSWPNPTLPDYLNGVAIVETAMAPEETLKTLHDLEARFGRRRTEANAPRTLDLDLIAHGRSIIAKGGLVLPHPQAAERRFVMGPLAEIAPDWIHPVLGETAQDLAAKASVGADASSAE